MKLKRISLYMTLLTLLLVGSLSVVSAQSRSAETLAIGFIGASAGHSAERDRQLYQAAVLAAEEINNGDDDDLAGIRGPNNQRYEFEVVYYDADSGDDAVDALADAVNDDVIAVLGPQQTSLAEALADEGNPDVPVIFAAPDAQTGTRLFRAVASYDNQAEAAADYLVNERHFTRIGVVAANITTAQDGAAVFMKAAGSDLIVADLRHEADEADFRQDAIKIRDSKAQAIYVWTLDASMINLLDALRNSGWDGVIVYAGLDADFVALAGDAAHDVIGPVAWSPSAYDSASQSFLAAYETRWDETPLDEAAAYYDSVYLLAKAVERAGDSVSSITSQLNGSSKYSGVQGEYSGVKTDALRLMQVIADGQFIEAARYTGNKCATCPDIWWVDTIAESARNSETFNIGLITASSGPTKATADHIEQAVRLAVRDINEAGGVLRSSTRYTLNLRVYTAVTNDDAATVLQQAVDDGMQIILGPDFNGQVLSNLNAAANAEIVQIVSATSPQITSTEASDYVFQVRSTDAAMAEAAASYVTDVRELTEIAAVAIRADYGLDAVDAFADAVDASDDGRLALRLEHAVDQTDMTAQAQQIADANVEAVAVWSSQPAALDLLTALDELGWDGLFVYGYLTPEFIGQAAASDIEIIGPVSWWTNAADWVSRDFTVRYSERYGEAPAPQTSAYYDAVYLAASALESSGSASGSIRRWLAGVDEFTGVQGVYKADDFDNGELTRSVLVVGLQNGEAVELARYDGASCLVGCES